MQGYIDKMISAERHDVIINMMYQDLHKKTGWVGDEDQPGHGVIVNYDLMYGDNSWQDIVRKLQQTPSGNLSDQLENDLMEKYRAALLGVDNNLAIKSIGLKFSEQDRTIYYLYLTTHDPTGALRINKILWESEFQQYELKWRLWEAKKKSTGQQFLFSIKPERKKNRPTTESIANEIESQLTGRTIELRELYRYFANDIYFASEIRSALKYLRKNGKADFTEPLRNSTQIIIK